jgi:hypothetical protein
MSNATTLAGAGLENGKSNPLVGLAVAAINAILYVLDKFKNLVTWCTITSPGYDFSLYLIIDGGLIR